MQAERAQLLPVQQLIILACCRFCQPFAIASTFAYFPEYIEYLGIDADKVSIWVGILAASFNAGECLSAFPCATLADQWGRRPTILITLGLCLIFNLAIGFCKTIPQAVFCIVAAGLMNGNVAVMRTSVADLVPDESLQPKAFAFLPTAAGLGTILGPVVGGSLAHAYRRYPRLFGGITLFERHPFALPTMISAVLFLAAFVVAVLYLPETKQRYTPLKSTINDNDDEDRENGLLMGKYPPDEERDSIRNSFDHEEPIVETSTMSSKWIHVSNLAIWINAICGLHAVAFDHMLPVFLHHDGDRSSFVSILSFGFGFGKDSRFIGILMTIAGVFGMATTILAVPRLIKRFGNKGALRITTIMFPIVYLLFPWSVLPSSGLFRIAILVVLVLLKVAVSVAGLQSCLILITNSVPKVDLAGAHGVNFAIASTARGIGSLSSGLLFSYGVQHNLIVLPFWVLALWALLNVVLSFKIR